jgi:hypothetical protein
MRAPLSLTLCLIGGSLAVAGCDLEEVTLVDAEDVVVAEVYLNVTKDPANNEIRAFLHRTIGSDDSVDALVAARVTVRRTDGRTYELSTSQVDDCVQSSPVENPGACFLLDDSTAVDLAAGDIFEVEVLLIDGGRITGAAQVPGDFELDEIAGACRLPPDGVMEITWSRSDEAWAYLNETSVRGLPDALQPEGIVVEEDPLYLLGLSISDSDTTISFPSEFGLFNRVELDQDLAVRLQSGLPEGTSAEIAITAVDRNFVNWARGGNFNPSGQVRVPSLSGAGTGVFGATIGRTFQVFSSRDPIDGIPVCPGVVDPV